MLWFSLQVNEGDSEDTDLQIFCVSCSHPVNPKVALRHMERCYAKVIIFKFLFSSFKHEVYTPTKAYCLLTPLIIISTV